jgi:arginine exporter protein ArgO
MRDNRVLGVGMGIFVGMLAAAVLVVLDYPPDPRVYLPGAMLAGVIGCFLSGWKQWWSIAGSLLGTLVASALLFTSDAFEVWRTGEFAVGATWIQVLALAAAVLLVVVAGPWVRRSAVAVRHGGDGNAR